MQWWCAAQGIPWEWSWRPYPGVWLFVALLAGAYGLGGGWGEEVPPRRRLAFGSGLLVLWAALDWPVGALGAGYLASVHMVQFLLIALVAPPLLLLGVAPLVDRGGGERGDGRPAPWTSRAARFVTHPLVTLSAFTVLLAVTHWPPVVDGLMASQPGSFALDVTWLGAGLLFWWPVVMAVPERGWFQDPARMGYLVAGTIVNTGVFAFLTFSELPVYATYELAPPVAGFSARDDQLLAGLLMKMGGAAVLWTAVTILFFRWFVRQEREDGRVAADA
ncbi:MAG TPA: cytochrome c oxidase assembly protein [Longimicrobiales bacterium]|nr:cytochrome c oxidase assembly protein [Longimicrobiales bacterium]